MRLIRYIYYISKLFFYVGSNNKNIALLKLAEAQDTTKHKPVCLSVKVGNPGLQFWDDPVGLHIGESLILTLGMNF